MSRRTLLRPQPWFSYSAAARRFSLAQTFRNPFLLRSSIQQEPTSARSLTVRRSRTAAIRHFASSPSGSTDSWLRAQMIDAAERTLDLQYFIFRGDETGRLLTDALLRAADRGVRVRVLVDDGATVAGDEQIIALDAHPNIRVRIFNPFAYRGHSSMRRTLEFMLHASRLDYRMHNKLLVVDNAVALVGGRNIGNQYFQMDPESQFADDDVFAAGPIAVQLSATFDEFWNSPLAVPAAALDRSQRSREGSDGAARRAPRERSEQHLQPLNTDGIDYAARDWQPENPTPGSSRADCRWCGRRREVVCDSPDKKNIESGDRRRPSDGPVGTEGGPRGTIRGADCHTLSRTGRR